MDQLCFPSAATTLTRLPHLVRETPFSCDSIRFSLRPATTRLRTLFDAAAKQFGLENEHLKYTFGRELLLAGDLISDYGLEDDDEIFMHREQLGGKPLIYLMPPSGVTLSATVLLSLIPAWSFSAVYPSTPVKKTFSSGSDGERVGWEVTVKPGGEMVDKAAGAEVAYLFWEAQ